MSDKREAARAGIGFVYLNRTTISLPSAAGPAVDWLARKLLRGEQPPPLAALRAVSYPEEAKLRPLSAAEPR